uniref:Uncharacterized protein n=1 Tax=Oryza punctata TaxID=4537 RepID=A0A0E0M3Q3_ORYPU
MARGWPMERGGVRACVALSLSASLSRVSVSLSLAVAIALEAGWSCGSLLARCSFLLPISLGVAVAGAGGQRRRLGYTYSSTYTHAGFASARAAVGTVALRGACGGVMGKKTVVGRVAGIAYLRERREPGDWLAGWVGVHGLDGGKRGDVSGGQWASWSAPAPCLSGAPRWAEAAGWLAWWCGAMHRVASSVWAVGWMAAPRCGALDMGGRASRSEHQIGVAVGGRRRGFGRVNSSSPASLLLRTLANCDNLHGSPLMAEDVNPNQIYPQDLLGDAFVNDVTPISPIQLSQTAYYHHPDDTQQEDTGQTNM